jgi:hypothetical protein
MYALHLLGEGSQIFVLHPQAFSLLFLAWFIVDAFGRHRSGRAAAQHCVPGATTLSDHTLSRSNHPQLKQRQQTPL